MRNDTTRYDEAFKKFKVKPIDMEAMKSEAEKMFRESGKINDDETILIGSYAILEGTDGKKHILDTDCVENGLSFRTMIKGPNYINTYPGFGIMFESPEEIKTLKPVSLRDFMGDRYGYNSRILSNMNEWMDIIQ